MKPYFANLPAIELASEIIKKTDDYYLDLQTTGRLSLWRRSYDNYYRSSLKNGKITRSGDQGEYSSININHYRNLLKHLQTMTTSQRPNFEPRATNTDAKSQAQAILANCLLDYYLREKKMERYLKQAVEHALVFGEGFIRAEWNATTGEVYGINPDTGTPIYQGDIKYTNLTPLDVIRDYTKNTPLDHSWYIVRTFKNKYDLAAKYPDLEDKILNMSDGTDKWRDTKVSSHKSNESDEIPVYEFYHSPTEAVPNGRILICLDADVVLLEGSLPYRELPVYRISASELIDSSFGYTVAFDLLPVQEALDMLYSTVTTNQSTFGVQNVAIPKGSGLSVTNVSGGLNLIEYDAKMGAPTPLNLTQTPAEIFNFIQMLEKVQETLSGVNSVSRGNPEASLKSGAALALVQSMAIQFSMDLQQSYAQLLEDLGTATLNLLKDFAKVPRVAAIAGRSNRRYMKEFTGDDLSEVSRVTVDMGNPLTRTTAGKVNLAETLTQNGFIDNPDQYLMVLQTGRLEPVTESKTGQLMLIRGENEKLAEGKSVSALITDRHDLHILEHASVASSPEARENPTLMTTLTAHIQEHINMYKSMDPVLAQILKMQPQQQQSPQVGQGANPVSQMINSTNPVTQEAANVNMPNIPQAPGVPTPNSGNL